MADYPNLDIDLVIARDLTGNNYKISNLINMYPHARHGILVIADDDMRVTRNYLSNIVAPFTDQEVGIVTCLYSGSPRGGIISSLHAMFINEWFLPSALVGQALYNVQYCFGATIVVKREILAQIGGFDVLADYLADDYMLGKLVTDNGHTIHLSHVIIENIIHKISLKSMLLHELRWARTLRTVAPVGYFFTFLTDTVMISCLAACAIYFQTQQLMWPLVIVGSVLLIRMFFHLRIKSLINSRDAGSIWLIPIRDFLTFILRLLSFTGNKIAWKGKTFSVDNIGLIYNPAE